MQRVSLVCIIGFLIARFTTISLKEYSIQYNDSSNSYTSPVNRNAGREEIQTPETVPESMLLTSLDLTKDDIQVINTLLLRNLSSSSVDGNNNNTTGKEANFSHHHCHAPLMVKPHHGRCCMGAVSQGRDQRFVKSYCIQNIQMYERLKDLSDEQLASNPVVYNSNSNNRCDVCQIVQIVASLKHSRIAIVGDSTQRQLFSGFECELHRRGFQTTTRKLAPWNNTKKYERPPETADWKYGIKQPECFRVILPEWMTMTTIVNDNNDNGNEKNNTVEICKYGHYRPYLNMEQHQQIAERSDVMIIDYGLHFVSTSDSIKDNMIGYEESLNALMRMFKNNITTTNTRSASAPSMISSTGGSSIIRGCHLMYRETFAQHFETEGGDYESHAEKLNCVPHSKPPPKGWLPERTKVLYRAAASQGFALLHPSGNDLLEEQPASTTTTGSSVTTNGTTLEETNHRYNRHGYRHELTLLPFWDFTAKLSYMHPGKGARSEKADCTHFCYSPHLWYPVWRHLRNALDGLVLRH